MIKVAVCVSAGSPKREWAIQNYIEAMHILSDQNDIVWILLGNGERAWDYARSIIVELNNECIINLVDKTTLRQTYSILKYCDVYLGGDTGPMHMAVASGIAGVVISCHPNGADIHHVNAPERFGPWNTNSMIVLRPKPLSGCENGCDMSYAHCINEICVNDVVNSMQTIIDLYLYDTL